MSRLTRLRSRTSAAWPTIRARLVDEGGLRSVLLLVLALGSGARAEGVLDAAAPVGALLFGIVSLALPDLQPQGSGGRVASYLLARLSERGTHRSLGALLLGVATGASAVTLIDHAEAVAIVLIGAVSAAKAPSAQPPKEGP
jgi:hypothetical protein